MCSLCIADNFKMEVTMERKVKIGVIGVGRGTSMMNYCKMAQNAELVAVCDKWEEGLLLRKKEWGDQVALYTDYDEFLKFVNN